MQGKVGAALRSLSEFCRGGVLVLCVSALATACHAAGTAEQVCLEGAVAADVAVVADARTVRLVDGRLIRLAGIETFALLASDAAAADTALHNRLVELLSGRAVQVRLITDKPDRYGRHAALLAAGDVPLVQSVLAREGLVIAFEGGKAVPCFAALLAAEDEGRRGRRGFWAEARVLRATADALAARSGGFAIFEGEVLSVGNRRARTYLNFGARWSADVTVEIDSRHRGAFGGEAALAAFAGKRVRVRGFVEERGGPLVKVSSPLQVETLEAAAAARISP